MNSFQIKSKTMEVSSRTLFKLIVAVCENNGIGKNNNLPWRLKSEMAYFARMTKDVKCSTKQNAVIMGRKTWESIPEKFRPLKGRLNIVLSSLPTERISDNKDVLVCKSYEEAVLRVSDMSEDNRIESCWIIGGSSVYEEAMKNPRLDRIYLTKIMKNFDCDTYFPNIDSEQWKEITDDNVSEEVQEENGIQFKYYVYQRNLE